MSRYFVTIITNTDGDLTYQDIKELVSEPYYRKYRRIIGDFATLEEAVAVCKKQYQNMVDTLHTIEWRREKLIEHFNSMITRLDNIKEDRDDHILDWDDGNRFGECMIYKHDYEDAIAVIQEGFEIIKQLNEKGKSLGYYYTIYNNKVYR